MWPLVDLGQHDMMDYLSSNSDHGSRGLKAAASDSYSYVMASSQDRLKFPSDNNSIESLTIANNSNSKSISVEISEHIVHVMQDEISLLWIIFGTIGNILSLLVLLRKKMRIHSTFTYLTLLALCDTFVLYFGMLRDYLVNNYDMNINGALMCKMHVFFFYFVLHMASWLLVAVNIDRLIAASFLSLSKKWCTPRTALKVSFYIAIGVFLVNFHFIFYVHSQPESKEHSQHHHHHHSHHHPSRPSLTAFDLPSDGSNFSDIGQPVLEETETPINEFVYKKCLMMNKNYIQFFNTFYAWIDASAQVILPFIIMVICNINIIHKVLLTKNKTNGKNLKRLRKIKGMCIMIVTVSIIFFVLEAPVLILICLIRGNWIDTTGPHVTLLWTTVNLMMYTNHVINFFTYCMAGTKFRRELFKLFGIHKLLKLLSTYKYFNFISKRFGNGGGGNNAMLANKAPRGAAFKHHVSMVGGTTPIKSAQGGAKSLIVPNDNDKQEPEKTLLNIESDEATRYFTDTTRRSGRPGAFSSEHNVTKHMVNVDIDVRSKSVSFKPVNLTSLIMSKKALLGESAVMMKRQNAKINEDDDDDDDDDSSSTSSSSSDYSSRRRTATSGSDSKRSANLVDVGVMTTNNINQRAKSNSTRFSRSSVRSFKLKNLKGEKKTLMLNAVDKNVNIVLTNEVDDSDETIVATVDKTKQHNSDEQLFEDGEFFDYIR